MKDWPAAHSMDTTWFAVDADGNIGVFDTGEDGAFPYQAQNTGDTDGSIETSDPSFDFFSVQVALLARAAAENIHSVETSPSEGAYPAERVIVFIADPRSEETDASGERLHYRSPVGMLTTVESSYPEAGWIVVREKAPRVLLSSIELDTAKIEKIAKRRDVVAVVRERDRTQIAITSDTLSGSGNGFFRYRHDYAGDANEAYQPGLYAREAEEDDEKPDAHKKVATDEPQLKLTDLPASAHAIGKLRFPFRFAETKRFQLADHMGDQDCAIWAQNTTLRGKPINPDEESSNQQRQVSRIFRHPFFETEVGSRIRSALPGLLFGVVILIALGIIKRCNGESDTRRTHPKRNRTHTTATTTPGSP